MSRAPFNPKRIERVRAQLGISTTEMAWLLAADPTNYSRWMRTGTVRFRLVPMLVELVERALDHKLPTDQVRDLMGIYVPPDGIPKPRPAAHRTDEKRLRTWSYIAGRAFTSAELNQQPLDLTNWSPEE